MNVGVFLSSSASVSATFLGAAEELGRELAKAKLTIVYGGSNSGCMGALADGAASAKGRLLGIIPEMDFVTGLVEERLTEKVLVSDLSERKGQMINRSDAFVAFPGGLGTLDEITEVLALRQIEAHHKPIVFYNYLGFWTPFLESLETFFQQRMITTRLEELFVVLDRASAVITYLNTCHRN